MCKLFQSSSRTFRLIPLRCIAASLLIFLAITRYGDGRHPKKHAELDNSVVVVFTLRLLLTDGCSAFSCSYSKSNKSRYNGRKIVLQKTYRLDLFSGKGRTRSHKNNGHLVPIYKPPDHVLTDFVCWRIQKTVPVRNTMKAVKKYSRSVIKE